MSDHLKIAREYVAGLKLRDAEKEEVENVIAGYMSDCIAKDKQIERLEVENARLKQDLKDWNDDCLV